MSKKAERRMAVKQSNALRISAGAPVFFCLALVLGGCSSTNVFSTSALDLFGTSSKASAGDSGDGAGGDQNAEVDCPDIQIRSGASSLMIGSKPGEGEPSALDLRYQASITRTARECRVAAGVMTMKVGIEGRVITGPAGGPGTVDVPLRLAVVQEGINPKTIVSKFAREQVTIASAADRQTFTHIDPDISFPMPQPAANIDSYVVYIGFDPLGAQEKKKPAAKPKPRVPPRPRQS
jgi:hypothetical protein